MTTYLFTIVIEPDEDKWVAYCPALVDRGAATQGQTREEAITNIHEVVQMVVQSMIAHNEPLPIRDGVEIISNPAVAITV